MHHHSFSFVGVSVLSICKSGKTGVVNVSTGHSWTKNLENTQRDMRKEVERRFPQRIIVVGDAVGEEDGKLFWTRQRNHSLAIFNLTSLMWRRILKPVKEIPV